MNESDEIAELRRKFDMLNECHARTATNGAKAVLKAESEIARLRDVMFTAANCDPKRDRPDCYDPDEACWCSECPFWTSDCCDVDGWEPPEDGV